MKKKILSAMFNAVFITTYMSFSIFLYLFATRITPLDIDYFIEYTRNNTEKLTIVIEEKIQALTLFQKPIVLVEASEIKEAPIGLKAKSEDTSKETAILSSDSFELIYYSQEDPRWKDVIYGLDNTIGSYGCGPTALAMVLSTLKGEEITPVETSKWAYENGHFSNNSGSCHSIIPEGALKYGLKSRSLKNPTEKEIIDEISNGNLIVVLMKKGTFTDKGHFLIIRGITKDLKALIADPKSLENSESPWDIDVLLKEAKYYASHGGPFWVISKT